MTLRIVVLAIALVAGLLAAYLTMNMQSAPPSDVIASAPQFQSRDVLVAARDIPPGSALSRENVRWLAWPEEGVSPAFMVKSERPQAVNEVEGAIVRSQFYEGEPIREGKLARAESGFLSAILPSGKRAAAVRVTAQSTAGGFILPNDHVDVIHTSGSNTVSQTILRNIRVLAIDQMVEEKDGERVVVGKTATLELDPGQVEIITGAETSGTISLALRSMADVGEEDDSEQRKTGVVRIFRSGQSQLVKTQ